MITDLEIDNFSSDVSTIGTCLKKKSISVSRESADLTRARALAYFDLRTVARFIYIFDFSSSPTFLPPSFPSRSGYIKSNISPSVFGGYIPALSPILSCRQLQTRRPITVSDEGAAGTQEPPFFGITYEYLDLILVRLEIAPTARLIASAAFGPHRQYVEKKGVVLRDWSWKVIIFFLFLKMILYNRRTHRFSILFEKSIFHTKFAWKKPVQRCFVPQKFLLSFPFHTL